MQASNQERVSLALFIVVMLMYFWWAMMVF
jgi:hypothetical protein